MMSGELLVSSRDLLVSSMSAVVGRLDVFVSPEISIISLISCYSCRMALNYGYNLFYIYIYNIYSAKCKTFHFESDT